MSRSEKIKEQIGWLKVIFGILSAILVTLSGWLAVNYNKADTGVVVIAVILIVLVSMLIVLINRKAYDKMDELEEL